MVLHALRATIGDDAFFELLRRWAAENAGTSRSTEDFIALASDVAGTDLTSFFDDWLFARAPPTQFRGHVHADQWPVSLPRIALRHFSGSPVLGLVAVGPDGQADDGVDADPAQRLGLPLA